MTTELGERLDELAAFSTTGLELRNPEFPGPAGLPRNDRRVPLALVASVVLLTLLFGGWWFAQRENSTIVDLAGGIQSQRVPSLLLEEPTPLAALPDHIANNFREARAIRPIERISPNAAPLEFPGVHVVERGDVTVVVGLDSTGQILCIAESIGDSQVTGSSCGTAANFAAGQEQSGGLTNLSGDAAWWFVSDDVVAVEAGQESVEVIRNVAVFNREVGGPVALRRADGSVNPGAVIPDPAASGELIVPGEATMNLAQVGCSLVDGSFVAELTFVGNGFLSVVVTPDGVYLDGSDGIEAVQMTVTNALIESDVVDGDLRISAAWEDDSGDWKLSADCGSHLIDLSDIR